MSAKAAVSTAIKKIVASTTTTTTKAKMSTTSTTTAAIKIMTNTNNNNKPKFRYLSAWFCPYAHRATIALEYHQSSIDYEWIEALGWYQTKTTTGTTKKETTTTSDKKVLDDDTTSAVMTTAVASSNNDKNDDSITTTNNNINNNNADDDATEWYYHWKADELKRVNPSALVPTLIPIITTAASNDTATDTADDDGSSSSSSSRVDESKAVFESLVTIDYIDLVANQYQRHLQQQQQQQQQQEEDTTTGINISHDTNTTTATGTAPLVPHHDPYEYARCRIWVDKVNRECCSPYYDVLVRQDPIERNQYFQKLLQGITNFSLELSKTNGRTFLSNEQICNVDIALFPWAYRYYVLQHYCGPEFVIPVHEPQYQAYHTWYQYMMSLPYIQRTLPEPTKYLLHIQKYANGTARSKVANAVRRNVPAHELDDQQDDYDAK